MSSKTIRRSSLIAMLLAFSLTGSQIIYAKGESQKQTKKQTQQQTIKIKKITGTIKVIDPNGTITTYTYKDKLPQFAAGTTFKVISGTIDIVIDNIFVTLTPRQAVTISKNMETNSFEVAIPEENIGNVKVKVGENSMTLVNGNAVSITLSDNGKQSEIYSISGDIIVSNNSGTQTLSEGSTITVVVVMPQPPIQNLQQEPTEQNKEEISRINP